MASPRVRVVVTSLEGFVARIITALALNIVANLVRAPGEGGTPVDTGWARANWVPRIGEPFKGTAGTREQAEAGNVSQADQGAGLADLVGYKLERGKVYVTNNVPYIVRLNEGSSRQAPAGFVQDAVAKAVRVDLPASFGVGGGLAGGGGSGGPARDPTTGRFKKR
jgi:hypothetical protein